MDPTPPPPPPPSPEGSSEGPSEGSSEASSPASSPPATLEWRLASPDGSQQFGPTVPAVFAQWIAEGRVQPDWLVWRSDWSEWKTAAEAAADLPVPLLPVPLLPQETPPQTAPPKLSPETPTAPTPTGASYTARRRRSKRQRRTLALVLGVVTLVLLGVLVWLLVS